MPCMACHVTQVHMTASRHEPVAQLPHQHQDRHVEFATIAVGCLVLLDHLEPWLDLTCLFCFATGLSVVSGLSGRDIFLMFHTVSRSLVRLPGQLLASSACNPSPLQLLLGSSSCESLLLRLCSSTAPAACTLAGNSRDVPVSASPAQEFASTTRPQTTTAGPAGGAAHALLPSSFISLRKLGMVLLADACV